MTIQERDGRTLRSLLAIVPIATPHYCDDLKTQRRVGKVISAYTQTSDCRIRTIWL